MLPCFSLSIWIFFLTFAAHGIRAASIADLPHELQQLIISKAGIEEILNLCASSKSMYAHRHDEALWRYLLPRDFPLIAVSKDQTHQQLYRNAHEMNLYSAHASCLSAGGKHTCALVAGGQVRCWGDNSWNQTAVPHGLALPTGR